jgi:hypothetical protein
VRDAATTSDVDRGGSAGIDAVFTGRAGSTGRAAAGAEAMAQSEGGAPIGVAEPAPKTRTCKPDSALAVCSLAAVSGFDIQLKWSWDGDGAYKRSEVLPLVANLDDDNADGAVDLCDVPDVVVSVHADDDSEGYIYVLDGANGRVQYRSERAVSPNISPSIGDLDGDHVPEIVTVSSQGELIAFTAGGKLLWSGDAFAMPGQDDGYAAVALADVDHDGSPEILIGNRMYDARGRLLRQFDETPGQAGYGSATTAADLDGDGELEIVLGRSAFHHDGRRFWQADLPPTAAGFPQLADLDRDGAPEIVLTGGSGVTILGHDGTLIAAEQRPNAAGWRASWLRPASIHGFGAAFEPALVLGAGQRLIVLDAARTERWSSAVQDDSGAAGTTVFDLLGNGHPNVLYADELNFFVFDDRGRVLFQTARSSRTLLEYPVVADVDADGAADALVVAGVGLNGMQTAPTLQVFTGRNPRWAAARRIWNQHTYHVTNVLEDGTIPRNESASWLGLNTFRCNARLEGDRACMPATPVSSAD